MLLSINQNKIAELLSATPNAYAVFTSEVPLVENLQPVYMMTSEVGTVYSAPLFVTAETKDHLMAARRQIEASGVPLEHAADLTKEIDDMRGGR
jgi:hypothetical protein